MTAYAVQCSDGALEMCTRKEDAGKMGWVDVWMCGCVYGWMGGWRWGVQDVRSPLVRQTPTVGRLAHDLFEAFDFGHQWSNLGVVIVKHL